VSKAGDETGEVVQGSGTRLHATVSQGQHSGIEKFLGKMTNSLYMSFESIQPMILNTFCEAPSEARSNPRLSCLERFARKKLREKDKRQRINTLPLGCLAEKDRFFNLHHFDMIQVPCSAPDGFSERVDFTFFKNPRFGP
jgi:hypothetical protein